MLPVRIEPELNQTISNLFSLGLGAIGWDCFSTISFDWRLLRETRWKSPFSAANSLAYWLSRYVTFGWILRTCMDGITASDRCVDRLKVSASLYGIAVCSTYIVFLLRTINIWNMRLVVVVPLTSIILAMIALCAVLPHELASQVDSNTPFCYYEAGGIYSYLILSLCAAFDLLNFILLGMKLSRSGFKGILRCLLPQTKSNYDREDVRQMLLQKTGIFTMCQLLLLISIAVLYGVVKVPGYQIMQVAAFHSIAASMAGRIFRRAWRLSREQSPTNINRPPDYSSDWTSQTRTLGPHSAAQGPATGNSPANGSPRGGKDSYIEGQLKPALKGKATSSLLPRVRPDSALKTAERRQSVVEGQDFAAPASSSSTRPSPLSLAIPRSGAGIFTRRPSVPPDDATHDQSQCSTASSTPAAAPPYEPSRWGTLTGTLSPTNVFSKKPFGMRRPGAGQPRASTSAGLSSNARRERSASQLRPQTTGSQISTPIQIIHPSNDLVQSPVTTEAPSMETSPRTRSDWPKMPTVFGPSLPEASLPRYAGPLSPVSTTDMATSRSTGMVSPSRRSSSPMLQMDPALVSTWPRRGSDPTHSQHASTADRSSRPARSFDPVIGSNNTLDAFLSTVEADEDRQNRISPFGSLNSGAVSPTDSDGRPRTSRGTLLPFGHGTDGAIKTIAPPPSPPRMGRLVLPQHDRIRAEGEVLSRPTTSYGVGQQGGSGSFASLRASSAGGVPGGRRRSSLVPASAPATAGGDSLSRAQRGSQDDQQSDDDEEGEEVLTTLAGPGSTEAEEGLSSIDATYRHLATLAAAPSTTSLASSQYTSSL